MAEGLSSLADALVNVVVEGAFRQIDRESLADTAVSGDDESVWIQTPSDYRTPRIAASVLDAESPARFWPGSEALDELERDALASTAERMLAGVVAESVGQLRRALGSTSPVGTADFSMVSWTPRTALEEAAEAQPTRVDRGMLEEVIRKEARSAVTAWMATGPGADVAVDDAASADTVSERGHERLRATRNLEREKAEAMAVRDEWNVLHERIAQRLQVLITAARGGVALPTPLSLGPLPLAREANGAFAQLELKWTDLHAALSGKVAENLLTQVQMRPLQQRLAQRGEELAAASVQREAAAQRLSALTQDVDAHRAAEARKRAATDRRDRALAECLVAQISARAMTTVLERAREYAREKTAEREAQVARRVRESLARRDGLHGSYLAEAITAGAVLRVRERKVAQSDAALRDAANDARDRANDAKQRVKDLRNAIADTRDRLEPVMVALAEKEEQMAGATEHFNNALQAERDTARATLSPYMEAVKDEQSKVVSLHREMDSLRHLMTLSRSPLQGGSTGASVEQEEATFRMEYSSDKLAFPTIRVPSMMKHELSKQEMSKSKASDELNWATKSEKPKMNRVGRRKLKDLAEIYVPAAVPTLDDKYGLPPDQARPQVAYRTLQPSLSRTLPSLQKSTDNLHHSRSTERIRDVEGVPVHAPQRWVLSAMPNASR